MAPSVDPYELTWRAHGIRFSNWANRSGVAMFCITRTALRSVVAKSGWSSTAFQIISNDG